MDVFDVFLMDHDKQDLIENICDLFSNLEFQETIYETLQEDLENGKYDN